MKRLASFLLSAALLTALIPSAVLRIDAQDNWIAISGAQASVEIEGVSYTVIRSAQDLSKLAEAPTDRFVLANDIDLGGAVISEALISLERGGVLDGNGYSILNFSLLAEGDRSVGLFDLNQASVKNLTVGSKQQPIVGTITAEKKGLGVLVGLGSGAITVTNVQVYAKLSGTNAYIGGLIGRSSSPVVLDRCAFYGEINGAASSDVGFGGMLGAASGTVVLQNCANYATVSATYANGGEKKTNYKVGGLIGNVGTLSLQLSDCANYGKISSDAASGSVGGLLGEHWSGGDAAGLSWSLQDCINAGTVCGVGNVSGVLGKLNSSGTIGNTVCFTGVRNYGAVIGSSTAIGGLIGYLTLKIGCFSLTDCRNEAEVSGTGQVGGLLGNSNGTNETAVSLTKCENLGQVSATSGDAGGLLGRVNHAGGSLEVGSCANLGAVSGGNTAGLLGANNGNYPLSVSDFLNCGVVTADSRAGGLIAYNGGGDVALLRCVNIGALSGKADSGGLLAYANTARKTTVRASASVGSITVTSGSAGCFIGANASYASCSDNICKTSGSANTIGGTEVLGSASEILAPLNARYAKAWGGFILNTVGEGVVVATPRMIGVQQSAVQDHKLDVRFVAVIQNSLRYNRVGFLVTVNDGEAKEIFCKYVYEALSAVDDSGLTQVLPDQFGGTYIYALSVTDVPADQTVHFSVTPFASVMDGNNEVIYSGETYMLTYENGVLKQGGDDGRTGWLLDFPAYTGGRIADHYVTDNYGYASSGIPDPNSYGMVLVSETDRAAFVAYADRLSSDGYTVEPSCDDGSILSYWVSQGTKRMYMYLSVRSGEARFITNQNDSTSVKDFSYHYSKETNDTTTLYLYGLHMDKYGFNIGETYLETDATKADGVVGQVNKKASNCGLLMILKLADNSVLLIDGGSFYQMSSSAAAELDRFLHEITGTPENGVVTIADWLITHHHGDHYDGITRFLNGYHEKYDLKRMSYNFCYGRSGSTFDQMVKEQLRVWYPNLMYYRPHTGESVTLADVRVDFLYTCEDQFSATEGLYASGDDNDTSLVAQITFDGKTFMLLADITVKAQGVIMKNYDPERLKSDVMQVAHHGFNGVYDLYRCINPSITLYPQSEIGAKRKIKDVLKSVIENTVGGEANIYYQGNGTYGVRVVNGEVQVVDRRAVVGDDWDGNWGAFTPFA